QEGKTATTVPRSVAIPSDRTSRGNAVNLRSLVTFCSRRLSRAAPHRPMSASPEPVTLSRDVIGILIPQGTKVELPEGAHGEITQALGGSFTIHVQGHLFRIDGKDADALGKEVAKAVDIAPDASDEELEKAIWDQLRT